MATRTVPTASATTNLGPISGITVRRVVNDFIELTPRISDRSIGLAIDELIVKSLETGGQVQALTVEITDEDWRMLQEGFRK